MIEILNICLHQNSIFNMFTINLEDGREAPSKARKKGAKRLEFLVYLKIYLNFPLVLQITLYYRAVQKKNP